MRDSLELRLGLRVPRVRRKLVSTRGEFAVRSRMAGAPDFDIVYLRHSQASQVALSCRPRQPSLSIDWRGGPPPAGYFQLIGQLGSIMTGVPPDAVRTGAMECQKLALAAAYEMSEFEFDGCEV